MSAADDPTAGSLSEEGSDEARFPVTLDRPDQAGSQTQHHPPVVERIRDVLAVAAARESSGHYSLPFHVKRASLLSRELAVVGRCTSSGSTGSVGAETANPDRRPLGPTVAPGTQPESPHDHCEKLPTGSILRAEPHPGGCRMGAAFLLASQRGGPAIAVLRFCAARRAHDRLARDVLLDRSPAATLKAGR